MTITILLNGEFMAQSIAAKAASQRQNVLHTKCGVHFRYSLVSLVRTAQIG